jgi:hypothetical protein
MEEMDNKSNNTKVKPSNITDVEVSLKYGSIIRISTDDGKYDNTLFFIQNITNEYIDVIYNTNLKREKLLLNNDGTFQEQNIQSIDILFDNTQGYASFNNLVPNTKLEILLNVAGDETSADDDVNTPRTTSTLTGTISRKEEDMIVVVLSESSDEIYIDFQYKGLDPAYNIEKIRIIGHDKQEVTKEQAKENNMDDDEANDTFIDLNDDMKNRVKQFKEKESERQDKEQNENGVLYNDDENMERNAENGEEFMLIYSIDQQVDDYIEYSFKRKINKHSIEHDIKQYLELMKLYVDLPNGKKWKSLSKSMIVDHIQDPKNKMCIPVSTNAYQTFYIDEKEISRDLFLLSDAYDKDFDEHPYNINIKTINTTIEDIENDTIEFKDIAFAKSQQKSYHKSILIDESLPFYVFENAGSAGDSEEGMIGTLDDELFYYAKQQDKLIKVDVYVSQLSQPVHAYISGYVLPNREYCVQLMNNVNNSSVLTKSIQHQIPYIPLRTKRIQSTAGKTCDLMKDTDTYLPFKETHSDISDLFKDINMSSKDIYKCFYERGETNNHTLMSKLALFGINDFTKSDYFLFQRMIRENCNIFKKRFIEYQREIMKDLKSDEPFSINLNEMMYNYIVENYQIVNHERKTETEILNKSLLDQYTLLMFVLQNNNKSLKHDFAEDQETSSIISELNEQLQDIIQNNNVNALGKKLQEDVVKIYETLEELYNDNGKVVLKNVGEFTSKPYDYLFGYMMREFNYNGSSETFMQQLSKILESGDLTLEEHADLFQDRSLYENLISKLIEMKVNDGDRAYVKGTKTYYVYQNDGSWVEEVTHKQSAKKRRLLHIRNRDENFDQMKEDIINDFIIKLVEDIQTKTVSKNELLDFKDSQIVRRKLDSVLKKLKFKIREASLRCNVEKEKIAIKVKQSDALNHIVTSPYTPIFDTIMSYSDEDLDMKYNLLMTFIDKFTIDLNNKFWFMCSKTGAKLVPKYMHRLAVAHLQYQNHDEVLKMICKEEGTLSDDGSAWVHVESGYTIKSINFTEDYGTDENGNMINISEVYEDDDGEELDDDAMFDLDDDDIMEMNDIVEQKTNPKAIEIQQRIYLDITEKEILHHTINFINIYGFAFDYKDDQRMIAKEISNIYRYSGRNNKYKHSRHVLKMYSIMGFLLTYLQCKGVKPKFTFPGCTYSLEGYPLIPMSDKNEGLTYICCVLKKIKNQEEPYASFRKKTEKDIIDELFAYMEKYVMANQYIVNMLNNARIRMMKVRGQDNNRDKTTHYRTPTLFKPSLYPLDISIPELDDQGEIIIKSQSLKTYNKLINKLDYTNMLLQQEIQRVMIKQKPLLMQKYEQPFLVNFCCNLTSSRFLNYVTEDSNAKSDILRLLNVIEQYEFYKSIMHKERIYVPSINLLKSQLRQIHNKSLSIEYDDETVFRFFIKTFNFDNELPIPSILLDYGIKKPKDANVPYDKHADIKEKIKILRQHRYDFSQDQMIEILQRINIKNDRQDKTTSIDNVQDNTVSNILESGMKQPSHDNVSNWISELMGQQRKDQFMETRISYLLDYYRNFSQKFNPKLLRAFEKLITYIDIELVNDNELISRRTAFLKRLNYIFVCMMPNSILNNHNTSNITCKHWNLAASHYDDINTQHKQFYDIVSNFIKINTSEMISGTLSKISDYGSYIFEDVFMSNPVMDYTYQKYLFLHIINLYILNPELVDTKIVMPADMREEDIIKHTVAINRETIKMFVHLQKKSYMDYNELQKRQVQTKQSEKLVKTDYLKNMRVEERRAEKMKMNLKLGLWAFALDGKRVYKYSKQFYDTDKKDAQQIQDIVQDTYYEQSDTLNPYIPSPEETEQDEEGGIIDEETYNMNEIPEDDDYGERDGDEMYY